MMRCFGFVISFAALTVLGAAPSFAGGCPQGTVWREATPDDHVCVSPAFRAQVWSDNRTNPHETCPRWLVWREATPADHVCVDQVLVLGIGPSMPVPRETQGHQPQCKGRELTD